MSFDHPLAGCHILLIEGDYFISMELDQALREAGAMIVGPVGNVRNAMEAVKRDGFGLALLDLQVRGGGVFEIADELRSQGVPFFFAVDSSHEEIPDRFARVECWEKPSFDEQELIAKLARMCSRVKTASTMQASGSSKQPC